MLRNGLAQLPTHAETLVVMSPAIIGPTHMLHIGAYCVLREDVGLRCFAGGNHIVQHGIDTVPSTSTRTFALICDHGISFPLKTKHENAFSCFLMLKRNASQ